ncbi:MAG TPA: alpha/beta hydrolase [Spirochaetota bacterium]|nr:alpha/beta hydrolase [Spirochaetota bacterium]HNT09843.1 alpha/beta hydrolase [Spirochaetota bacterium]HNV46309.1 alpha/beta hydrolase [Spirochaetota bacterium]HOS38109.1 alpha/beta hydrolase [Spirochaetota bacterium]HPI22047.1 alpha/beta hydrolase [Spirochaetota bacterium]
MNTFIPRLLCACALLVPLAAFAGGSAEKKCNTKYPIILSHGMGVRDSILGVNYWYGIPDALRDEGARVYISNQNAFGSHAQRGEQLRAYIMGVLALYNYNTKVNIIGHSQGTLDSRYVIATPITYTVGGKTYTRKMSDFIASWTGIAGPNRGSAVADVILGALPNGTHTTVGAIINAAGWLMGDVKPDSLGAARNLTRDYMCNVFNKAYPDQPGVYYQSWAAKIKTLTADCVLIEPTHLILKFYEGDNDGLVSVSSAKWGNFRGVVSGAWWCGGVSHFNIVDQFFGVTPGFDAPAFYVDIVNDLKKRGY